MKDEKNIIEEVKDYYGKELQTSDDLKTSACCTIPNYPTYVKEALSEIHDEVLSKYYGCGLVMPEQIQGAKILDLGSGSGRDCYMLAKLVGESGSIVGVDMTDEQLDVAKKHLDYHKEKFGYKKSNVEFLKGRIEELTTLGLENESFDIAISNCVINLSTDKKAVLKDIYSLLKEGGEFYFSDVYSDRRIPTELVNDPVLYGECLSGALYIGDFERLASEVGFKEQRIVEARVLEVTNEEVEKKTGDIVFYSITYRLFKDKNMESACEDFGHTVKYLGTIDHAPESFELDQGHNFIKGKRESVCGNTYLMLKNSRFSKHFEYTGTFATHLGKYEDCGPKAVASAPSSCC